MLLLVLFGTLVSHSLFPHNHHHHSDSVVTIENHHHHDGEEQNHSDIKSHSKQSDSKGFLDFILGHHFHSTYNSDFTTVVIRNVQNQDDAKKLVCISANYTQQKLISTVTKKEVSPRCRDSKPEIPFLLNHSLRGPPSLG